MASRRAWFVAVMFFLVASVAYGQRSTAGREAGQGAATPGGRGGQRAGLPPRDRQPAPVGTARISGRVLSADGAPLRRAQVQLSAVRESVRKATTTDSDGRYAFTGLPAGRYTIRANKPGFVPFAHGQKVLNEAAPAVTVGDDEALTGVDVFLPRGSVIAGRVTDEFGDPVLQAQVQALRYQYLSDGQRQLVPGGNTALTDDLGQFRLYGLTPGEYVVSASARNQDFGPRVQQEDLGEGYAPTFYPGTSNPGEAQPITVAIAQETTLQLQLAPARLARLSGIVVNSQGVPATSGTPVMLRPAMSVVGPGGRSTNVRDDGLFVLTNVPPGDYLLEVRPRVGPGRGSGPGSDDAPEFASVPISVGGGEVSGLRIVTGKGGTISGRVVVDGAPPAAGMRVRVVAQPADPTRTPQMPGRNSEANGAVAADGTFQIGGISGPVFLRITVENSRVAAQSQQLVYMTRSVIVDGVDVADVPFDPTRRGAVTGVTVLLTDKLTEVSGTVTDGRGTATPGASVLIVPENLPAGVSPSRFVRVLQVDDAGMFHVQAMPAGRYVAVGLEAFDQLHQFDPDVQQRARQLGRGFSLREGEKVTLDLPVTDLH